MYRFADLLFMEIQKKPFKYVIVIIGCSEVKAADLCFNIYVIFDDVLATSVIEPAI